MSNDTGINIHSSAKHRRAIAKEKEVVSIPHQTSRWRERCAHAHSTSAFKACCRQNAFPESVVHYRLRSTGRIVITCSLTGIRELRITLYGIGEIETTCVWHVLCILFNLSRKHARSRLSCVNVTKTLLLSCASQLHSRFSLRPRLSETESVKQTVVEEV